MDDSRILNTDYWNRIQMDLLQRGRKNDPIVDYNCCIQRSFRPNIQLRLRYDSFGPY